MVWDEQADVVVVGSGAAGLSAALEARKAGATVAVFEKMKVTGGNSRISDGGLAAPGNHLQRQAGVEDSPERFEADMVRAGLGLNHPRLVRVLAEEAAGAIEWTREVLGVRYQQRLDRFGGHEVARCLTTRSHSGLDIIRAQSDKLREMGVNIRTGCLMTRLFMDTSGAVEGIELRSGYRFPDRFSGSTIRVSASRAVVLATGGYAGDVLFRTLQIPGLGVAVPTTNHRGATAEGLIAALQIHAAPIHLSWIQLGPWGCADEAGYGRGARFASYSVYPHGILVDPATGRRIANEWADRRHRAEAILKTGHACLGVVDAAGAEADPESLDHGLRTGKIKTFETLGALAEAYDIPSSRLEATVADYHRMIQRGETDSFGKPLIRDARPLARPPFYAIRLWPKVHYTPGGIGIDARARVIDLESRPIPGLYATGEVCGGIHGAGRLSCCALTECIVFGRIAGREAASMPDRSAG
ncbi:MAG: flavocytochrome c [Desulfobacterales bacterium]